MPNLFSYSGFNLSNNDGVAGYGVDSFYNFANFLNGSSDSIGSFFGSLGSLVAAGGESNCSYDGSGSDEHLFHDFFVSIGIVLFICLFLGSLALSAQKVVQK